MITIKQTYSNLLIAIQSFYLYKVTQLTLNKSSMTTVKQNYQQSLMITTKNFHLYKNPSESLNKSLIITIKNFHLYKVP
jgi:hypothetical protein